MKAIILGATGLIGTSLTRQLAAHPACSSLVTLGRRDAFDDLDTVSHQIVNFDNLAAHASQIAGDVLFSALGTTKKQAGSIAAQRLVDVDYQLEVAKIAAKNNVSHLVLVSSSGADVASANPYLKMKGDLETAIQQLPFQRISILQPSLMLGPRQSFRGGELAGQFILPLFTWLPALQKYRPIHCDVVASKMIAVHQLQTRAVQTYRLDEVFNA
jgi:uncharacterized protein YbjT (DUF2867 family)